MNFVLPETSRNEILKKKNKTPILRNGADSFFYKILSSSKTNFKGTNVFFDHLDLLVSHQCLDNIYRKL